MTIAALPFVRSSIDDTRTCDKYNRWFGSVQWSTHCYHCTSCWHTVHIIYSIVKFHPGKLAQCTRTIIAAIANVKSWIIGVFVYRDANYYVIISIYRTIDSRGIRVYSNRVHDMCWLCGGFIHCCTTESTMRRIDLDCLLLCWYVSSPALSPSLFVTLTNWQRIASFDRDRFIMQ